MSGLRLDTRDAALKGGTRGPAIQPGNSGASRLLQLAAHTAQPAMPPGRKLSDEDIASLRNWIDEGALFPTALKAPEQPKWWSFQKPKRPAVPAVPAWGKNAVDAFIAAKFVENGLPNSPEADRLTLIRRATFDLHGLAPTPAEVRTFLEDRDPAAYEKLVDRLLASPRYGEKWGRYWLDLVRYGDTSGFEQDPYILEAWRYRDWVIKSLNTDKPYDRFVKEQIAGDELWPESPDACSGTGYFCVGANRDMLFKVEDINRVETLADYVDTTSSVFLGLSVGCARCHDHKFDPIPQRDYYRMQAIFAPATKTRVFIDYNPARFYDIAANTREFRLRQVSDEIDQIFERARKKLREAKLAPLGEEVRKALNTPDNDRTPRQQDLAETNRSKVNITQDELRAELTQEEREKLQAVEKRLVTIFTGYKPPPMAPGITDSGREAPRTYIAVRGNPSVRGEEVGPGFLTALGGGDVPEPAVDSATTQRRKALAEWIASSENPLTARVIVNRIWQGHFGRGIVATPSDYGIRGAKPTHPELLDWLATEFMQRGWSMKQMHRLLMTSATYRQQSRVAPTAADKDPENVWLSHMNRRRLSAEEIRDAVLQASGDLNLKMEGIPVVAPLTDDELYGIIGKPESAWIVTADSREHTRRSIYLLNRRTFRMPMMELFDAPDGVLSCSRRESSTIAPQSLAQLNGRFSVERARSLAAKLAALPESERIEYAWWQTLSRAPKPDEKSKAEAFIERQKATLNSESGALQELARGLFNLNEFLYVE